jgi:hypothetical protein
VELLLWPDFRVAPLRSLAAKLAFGILGVCIAVYLLILLDMHGQTRRQIEKVLEVVKELPGLRLFASARELDEYLTSLQRKVLEGE